MSKGDVSNPTAKKRSTPQCCKTCALYDIDYATDALGRVRRHAIAQCRWESKETRPASARFQDIRPRWMSPHEGTDCGCWEKRV